MQRCFFHFVWPEGVDALIAAGDVSQEYVDQQKKLLGR